MTDSSEQIEHPSDHGSVAEGDIAIIGMACRFPEADNK